MRWRAVAAKAVDQHGALQKPAELADFLTFMARRPHDLVVELGCDMGGTLWAWRQLADTVVGVTLPDGRFGTGRRLLAAEGAQVLIGDTHDLDTWMRLRELLGDRRADMLFIDADHTWNGAGIDVMAYSGLVASGGVLALHDICVHPRPGSEVAVHEVWRRAAGLGAEAHTFVTQPTTWGGIGALVLP